MVTLKTNEQIKRIEESCQLVALLLDTLETFIEAGQTTHDIDAYCHDFITKHKGKPAFLNYMGFPASACVSVNEEVIHGIPGNKKIVEGDLVSVDLGINLGGYFSDSARTYIVGQTTQERENLVKVTHRCLMEGIEGAQKPNARIHDISSPIFNLANSHGYGVVRDYCGHGVGLAVHEDPQVPNYVNPLAANPRL
ncbi:MAG: type I methionyl aminopeptidase, partial [Sphaerochaetaceae bacterium]